jgi:hypothetical protein
MGKAGAPSEANIKTRKDGFELRIEINGGEKAPFWEDTAKIIVEKSGCKNGNFLIK